VTELCNILLIPGEAGTVCGEPSAGLLRSACVHEHLLTDRVCPGCAVDLQHLAGTLICGPCKRAAVPHECMPRLVIEWHEGYREPVPVTVVQEVSGA
jgi:hypothetical protein